ncbi:MAG: nucleotidyltransferase domain-containing protein [Lactobacillales bacterium]|jgi:predicted nucleotidyltransferase|nr:nucleotidyltransferase domain-containing protein [Lactobacillales bacterium]
MDIGLSDNDLRLILDVFSKSSVEKAILFGSRAMGNYRYNSDIDIVVSGNLDIFGVQTIAEKLDELPLPYKFDILSYEEIQNANLLSHIKKFGVLIYEK